MGNIVAISHSGDIDGVASVALIRMKYGIDLSHAFFINHSRSSAEHSEKEAEKLLQNKNTIFVTDLSVNPDTIPVFERLIAKAKAKSGKVFWLDHHPWSDKEIETLAKRCKVAIVGENRKFCATELVHKELKPKSSKFVEELVSLTHYSDFNIRAKNKKMRDLIKTYALSIAYYNTLSADAVNKKLRHMVGVLSEGKFIDKTIADDASRFERLNDQRAADMVKKLYTFDDVAIGFARDIQSTYACAQISKKSRKDVALYVNVAAGKGHLRSKRKDISKLAKRLGGGGHPHAAGFNINASRFNNFKKDKDRAAFVSFIEKVLKE